MKYIIEHTENKIYDWCCIEYKHISKLVGRNNLIFKNLKAKRRNLTKEQMPTDVAVLAVKLISEGNKIENLKFKDKPVINIKKGRFNEEIILPYRYIMLYDKLIISKELIKYLKSKKDL